MAENEDEPVGGRIVIYAEIYDEEDPGDVPQEEPIEMEADDDGEDAAEEHFDITLAATHSYMGSELQEVSGRNVLEAGWRGVVPGTLHRGCVFPGETVPLLLLDGEDAATIANTLKKDKLFALLCPDETGQQWNGYGVVCEVFEAASAAPARYKARALHRCRTAAPPQPPAYGLQNKMRLLEVVVLGEVTLSDPLRPARTNALPTNRRQERSARALDALVTPWPLFVYDIFHYGRMRGIIKDYFKSLNLERMLPEEPVSLSFWVARNLTLAERDRLALFTVDNTLLRLHMECNFISRTNVVCCGRCGAELARRDHVFAMSSDGVHSTYTNPGGHMHDIVTVSAASNTELSGRGSAQYSWFPGYRWTSVVCARCMSHVGWRFDALRRNLRPAQFYGLCRNYAAPPPHASSDAFASPSDGEGGEGGAEGRDEGEGEQALHIPLLQFRLSW